MQDFRKEPRVIVMAPMQTQPRREKWWTTWGSRKVTMKFPKRKRETRAWGVGVRNGGRGVR